MWLNGFTTRKNILSDFQSALNKSNQQSVFQKQVSGDTTVFLGQERESWRPLIFTTVNLSDISRCGSELKTPYRHLHHCLLAFEMISVSCSIKSSFQLRTFDPEGVIFYGDTKNGVDWFVLSLKGGIPLMQIYRSGVYVSVAGGTKLSDGKWHTVRFY